MRSLFARKSVADFEAEVRLHGGLRRTLGKWHLTALGVGATIGAGIFATTGTAIVGDAARPGAGPAIIFSFVLTAVACGFAALCYGSLRPWCQFRALPTPTRMRRSASLSRGSSDGTSLSSTRSETSAWQSGGQDISANY